MQRDAQVAASVVLADGRTALVRPLLPSDRDALVAAVQRADAADLRRRFMGTPPSAALLVRQLERADGFHDLAVGAFDAHGHLVGIAQFDRLDDGPAAEVAVQVAKSWQRVGLGRALMSRLATLARDRGVHEFTATYFADNVAIRRLLREVGRVVASGWESGEGYARLDLDLDLDPDPDLHPVVDGPSVFADAG